MMGLPWTDSDIARLKELRESGMTAQQIADAMSRTINAIRRRIHKDFGRCVDRNTSWPAKDCEQLVFLRDNLGLSFCEIGKRMGKSERSCERKWYRLRENASAKPMNTGGQIVVPPEIYAERNARLATMPRDLTAWLCGDPLPGMSALDRRQ